MSALPKSHVIALGNQKEGTGKSTVAMHLAIGLIGQGYKVACLDLAGGQGALTRYLLNRRHYGFDRGVALPAPEIESLDDPGEALAAADLLATTLPRFRGWFDVIIIDGPGQAGTLGPTSHLYADTLLTPMSDRFADLDVLAVLDFERQRITRPSLFVEAVMNARADPVQRKGRALDWLVVRNRLAPQAARDKQVMEQVLAELARRIGFRITRGFSERAIFPDLFGQGLTLHDIEEGTDPASDPALPMAAQQEIRTLIATLNLPPPAPRPLRPPGGVLPAETAPPITTGFRFDADLDNADTTAELPSWTAMMGGEDEFNG